MGNEEDYYNGCDRPGRKPSLQARLQSGNYLFPRDSSSINYLKLGLLRIHYLKNPLIDESIEEPTEESIN